MKQLSSSFLTSRWMCSALAPTSGRSPQGAVLNRWTEISKLSNKDGTHFDNQKNVVNLRGPLHSGPLYNCNFKWKVDVQRKTDKTSLQKKTFWPSLLLVFSCHPPSKPLSTVSPQGGHPLVPGWPHLGGLLNSGPRKLLGIPDQGPAMGGQGQGPEQGLPSRNLLGVPSFINSLLGVFHKVTICTLYWSSLLWLYLSAQPTVSPTRKEEKIKISFHTLHNYAMKPKCATFNLNWCYKAY